jgi:hypothetical protein
MRSRVRLLGIACLLTAAARCQGGAALQVDGGSAGRGGSTVASAGASGGDTGICNGGCLCVRPPQACPPGCYSTPVGDCQNGPSPSGTSIRVPTVHRMTGATCSAERGPGFICADGPVTGPAQCASDSNCTAGMNGRCSSPEGPLPACTPFCSYDQCQSDADCPAHAPCECRDSPVSPEANLCVTGGNCAVDADCGPVGYCSPGSLEGLCDHPLYFCHTPQDTCTDDRDCPPMPTGVAQTCNYDAQAGHFACGFPCFLPA